eukprot:68473-Pleurochrysis_carterae.AAC.1
MQSVIVGYRPQYHSGLSGGDPLTPWTSVARGSTPDPSQIVQVTTCRGKRFTGHVKLERDGRCQTSWRRIGEISANA